jgi:hypothetical protein
MKNMKKAFASGNLSPSYTGLDRDSSAVSDSTLSVDGGKDMSKQIFGNTEVSYIRSMWSGYEKDILFFTSKRLIVAKISSTWSHYVGGAIPLIMERYQEKKKKEKLGEILPDDVLEMDKKNIAIPYSDIERVEVKKPGTISAAVKVITREKTHQFGVRKNLFEDFMRLTSLVLVDKLAIK